MLALPIRCGGATESVKCDFLLSALRQLALGMTKSSPFDALAHTVAAAGSLV
jgi:hypothetical protein